MKCAERESGGPVRHRRSHNSPLLNESRKTRGECGQSKTEKRNRVKEEEAEEEKRARQQRRRRREIGCFPVVGRRKEPRELLRGRPRGHAVSLCV